MCRPVDSTGEPRSLEAPPPEDPHSIDPVGLSGPRVRHARRVMDMPTSELDTSSEVGTRKTVKARLWTWRSDKSPDNPSSCHLFAWERLKHPCPDDGLQRDFVNNLHVDHL